MFSGIGVALHFASIAPLTVSRTVTIRTIGLTLLALFAGVTTAAALSQEQAVASCRESVGRPIVQACMRSMGGGGANREANLASCRAGVSPQVKACVMAALNKANGRANVAIELVKPKGEIIAPGNSLPAGFVVPPRTITDITAILDSEKPDAATLAKLKKNADDEKALPIARSASDPMFFYRLRQFLGLQKQAQGDLKSTLKIFQDISRETINAPGLKGWGPNANRATIQILLATGDVAQAEGYMRRSLALITEARTSGHPNWRKSYQLKGKLWESDFETSRGALFEARGQYREAEAAYKRAEDYRRASVPDLKNIEYPPPESQIRQAADFDALNVARMKAKQGRLAEAEVDARRALLSRLKEQGKYNPLTTRFVTGLASVLVEQGRYVDAEKLVRTALEIQRTVGIPDDTHFSAQIMSQLGAILTFQRKPQEAARVYAELDKAIATWEPARRQVLELNGSRIDA